VHPTDVEVFEIAAGRARYRVGRHVYEGGAPYTYAVPRGALNVHAANAGDTELRVRQTVLPAPPNPRLVAGVEAFFETTFALEQQGRVLAIGVFADPLQSAVTLHDLLFPFAYLPRLPAGVQEALIGPLAALAGRRGYAARVAPALAATG
jgi:hypothetical protein